MRRRTDLVLVVSHEASRTGAPKMAQLVLRALVRAGRPRHLVQRWGGPLAEVLAAEAGSASWEPLRRSRALLRRRGRERAAQRAESLAARIVLARRRPALVWANTVLSGSWVKPSVAAGVPVVLHVHEVEPMASAGLARHGLDDPRVWQRGGATLLACSEAVRRNLAAVTGLHADAIAVLPSIVDEDEVSEMAAAAHRGSERVVVACGTADRRKGFDLWAAMARYVQAEQAEPVVFRWIGAVERDRWPDLDTSLDLVGPVPDAPSWIAGASIFVHCAREDPFPLVVLEAMWLGLPVVAFDVGGVGEQLGDAGVLVPPGDVAAMAAAVSRLLADPAARRRLGAAARARASRLFAFECFQRGVLRVVDDAVEPHGGAGPGRSGAGARRPGSGSAPT